MTVVADSHAIVWYVQGSSRLSEPARAALVEAEAASQTAEATAAIVVSVATLVDLWYVTLTTQGVTTADLAELRERLADSPAVDLQPINTAIADAYTGIPRAVLTDPWDRFIVATAQVLDAPLVTRDDPIRQSGLVQTIW